MRRALSLNGEWDFAPDYAGLSPTAALSAARWEERKVSVPSSWRWSLDPGSVFQPFDVNGYPGKWNQALSGILSRRFIAEPAQGERAVLIFKGIFQRWAIFVNGALLREGEESFLPVEVDITGVIVKGKENEIAVWCGPFSSVDTAAGRKLLAPNGSWFAQLSRGIWQDVELVYRPSCFLRDAFVTTSVRAGRIDIQAAVANAGGSAVEGRLVVEILDGAASVARWTEAPVSIPAGADRVVRAGREWKNAVLWSPRNPHFYVLRLSWESAAADPDVLNLRFGFREVWLEKHKLILNGVPVFLRGDAWHYQGFVMQSRGYADAWFRLCRETGINCVRLHAMPYPECFLEAADESGMLLISESAIYGSSKLTQADHPEFLSRCRDHLRGLVRRDRNHPSVVMWSMQNEMRWVDGRDGYRAAMPGLAAAMRDLDPSRPISFDGDMRLVDPRDAEILSLHYTIDGTVAQWSREKPLVFGEHGAWHYVSPPSCAGLAGQKAYLDYDACMEGIGRHEQLFIEYARRNEVTGITPFNIVHYAMWSMPEHDALPAPGSPGTFRIPAGKIPGLSLTVNNGELPGEPLFRPNRSWEPVREAFRPVTVFTNEYDESFFGGEALTRSFSIYNDTLDQASVTLLFRVTMPNGEVLDQGETRFMQEPGVRREWQHSLTLPDVSAVTVIAFSLELLHEGRLVHSLAKEYSLHPGSLRHSPIRADLPAGYVGDDDAFALLSRLLPSLRKLSAIDEQSLDGIDALVIGPRFTGSAAALQPLLRAFVARPGFLLVLEQTGFTPGSLPLAARAFHRAFIADHSHPCFEGLTDADLRSWHPGSIWDPGTPGNVHHVFRKPTEGDARILLECGDGDFGWGGLLWTPLVEYAIGRGTVLLSQMETVSSAHKVPGACILLRNILSHACTRRSNQQSPARILALSESTINRFLGQIGREQAPAGAPGDRGLIIADPDSLDAGAVLRLRQSMESGAVVLVLPVEPRHAERISLLAGSVVTVENAPVHQLAAEEDSVTRGISAFDLYHIEKVTYSPDTMKNSLAAQCAVALAGGQTLLHDVKAPWVDFFIKHRDAEYQKIAVATLAMRRSQQPRSYMARVPVGKGCLILCQVLPDAGNEKIARFYRQLLANLGASIRTSLLERLPGAQEWAIDAFMALAREAHHDPAAIEAYFSDPGYTLNNLGEGVYGWMKRVEAQGGTVTIPGSAGRTWYLTTFVESEANLNPAERRSGQLPDPGMVPDFFFRANCAVRVYVNGKRCAAFTEPPTGSIRLDDVPLSKGINRIAIACDAGQEDVALSAWLRTKQGEPVPGLRYMLTLD